MCLEINRQSYAENISTVLKINIWSLYLANKWRPYALLSNFLGKKILFLWMHYMIPEYHKYLLHTYVYVVFSKWYVLIWDHKVSCFDKMTYFIYSKLLSPTLCSSCMRLSKIDSYVTVPICQNWEAGKVCSMYRYVC